VISMQENPACPDLESPVKVVGRLLKESGLSIGVAESCTGGLIAARLTDIPGSSEYFPGGVVAYSNALKKSLLGVPPSILNLYGAVSEETAVAMARGVRELTGSHLGLAVTGIAGPDGGTGAVDMDAQVQVGPVGVGQVHPPGQVLPLFSRLAGGGGIAQLGIRLPGQQHHGPGLPQAVCQAPADSQGDVLFQGAGAGAAPGGGPETGLGSQNGAAPESGSGSGTGNTAGSITGNQNVPGTGNNSKPSGGKGSGLVFNTAEEALQFLLTKFSRAELNGFIAMAEDGITPEEKSQVKAALLSRLTAEEYQALKVIALIELEKRQHNLNIK
jgi:PncC family amidohydrolase